MTEDFISDIQREIKEFYEKEYGSDLLFVIYYGSWVFGLNSDGSDLDIAAVCKKFNAKQLEETILFVKSLHSKYGLKLDEDIPYENKVVINSDFALKAIKGKGFARDFGKVIVQPIVKTREFLSSSNIAMRLFLNAIMTKNVFCGGDFEEFNKMREIALKESVRLFFSAWNVRKISLGKFVDNLIEFDNRTGQYYLGFENYSVVRNYLRDTYSQVFNLFVREGYLIKDGEEYIVGDGKWFKEIN